MGTWDVPKNIESAQLFFSFVQTNLFSICEKHYLREGDILFAQRVIKGKGSNEKASSSTKLKIFRPCSGEIQKYHFIQSKNDTLYIHIL